MLQGMVGQLVSGASVALEITGDDPETPTTFRNFVGPADPVSLKFYLKIVSLLFYLIQGIPQ